MKLRALKCVVYGWLLSLSAFGFAVDQCNNTSQCKNIFGSSATDCKDSRSNSSICFCGNSQCDAGGSTNPVVDSGSTGDTNVNTSGDNPVVSNGVATFVRSKRIGTQFRVPNQWKKIVINAGVTITGSFYVQGGTRTTSDLIVEGRNRKTSVIVGADPHTNVGSQETRRKSAVRYEGPGDLWVRNLTSKNSVKFHLHSFGNTFVDSVDIIETAFVHTSDAVHAGKGSNSYVKDAFINVYDDSTYVSEVALIEDSIIYHNKNGAPFQVGWGYDNFGSLRPTTVKNTEIIYGHTVKNNYNQGTLGWARHSSGQSTIHVKFNNVKRTIRPGYQPMRMFQFGSTQRGDVRNATMRIEGGCAWKNDTWKNASTSNSNFVFIGC